MTVATLVQVAVTRPVELTLPPPTALLYKPVDRVTRSTLVLHVGPVCRNTRQSYCFFFFLHFLKFNL